MKSFLKFLSRNKLYTAIEAAGLIISIAFVILIGNYVWQQYSIAYENPTGDRVYGIGNGDFVGLSWWDKYEVEQKIPEVEAACRIGRAGELSVTVGDDVMLCQTAYVDPEFWEMFPHYTISEGSLTEFGLKGRCLVAESFVNACFDDGEAVGRQISIADIFFGTVREYTICGVYPDFDNTMMQSYDILLNPEDDASQKLSDPFKSIGSYLTLIMVREGVDRETVARKVHDVCRPNYNETWISGFPIFNIPELYFHSGQWHFRRGNKDMLGMLAIVVLLLLVSAIFNYENLNLTLSGRRSKEMAMRRLLGSSRFAVFGRFVAESILFTTVCFGFAVIVAYALLPVIDRLLMGVSIEDAEESSMYMHMSIQWSAGIVAAYLFTILLLGTAAGIAPAALAARFQPIDIVRGTFRRRTKMTFSKIFIVFQNAVSVVLIALALVMEVQMHHMMTRPLNARSEGVYFIRFFSRTYDDVAPLVDRLQRIPDVGRTGYGSGYAGLVNMATNMRNPDGSSVNFHVVIADETFFDIMGLHILTDRNAPAANTLWMSRSLANELSLTDSLELYYGSQISMNGVRSEHFGGIYADIATQNASSDQILKNSVVLVARRDEILYGQGLVVEIADRNSETVEAVKRAYAEYSEEKNGVCIEPYQIGYIDDILSDSLAQIRTTMRLLEIFMLLSVMISLLGLVAMSTYFSGENTKSIAIRKVFGSDVAKEIRRTVSEYMILVAAAAAVGIPVAVHFAHEYLSRFAYRITGCWWIFAVATLVSVSVAFLSVLWQVLKAAKVNPANELKKE